MSFLFYGSASSSPAPGPSAWRASGGDLAGQSTNGPYTRT